jgi:hypothetical protein
MSRLRALGAGLLGVAGAAAVAAAVVPGVDRGSGEAPSVSPAAATASASSAPAADTAPPHGARSLEDLHAQFERMVPAGLRAELESLRDVPAEDRLAALEAIRDAALAGEHGEQAQAGAQRLGAALAMLPPELVGDLEAVVGLEQAQVPAAVERIRDTALAGGYGEQVRGWAERLVAAAEQHGHDVTGDLDRFVPSGD